MDALIGFEPIFPDSKSDFLPLEDKAILKCSVSAETSAGHSALHYPFTIVLFFFILVENDSLELSTSALQMRCSTLMS